MRLGQTVGSLSMEPLGEVAGPPRRVFGMFSTVGEAIPRPTSGRSCSIAPRPRLSRRTSLWATGVGCFLMPSAGRLQHPHTSGLGLAPVGSPYYCGRGPNSDVAASSSAHSPPWRLVGEFASEALFRGLLPSSTGPASRRTQPGVRNIVAMVEREARGAADDISADCARAPRRPAP